MLNKIKIGPKLIGGFVAVAAIAGVIGIFGIMKMGQIDAADTKLYEQITVPIGELLFVAAPFHQVRVNLRDMIRANDPETIRQKAARIDELSGIISKNIESYEKTLFTDAGKKLFQEFQEARKAFSVDLEEIKRLAMANKDAEAWALVDGHAAQTARAEQNAIEKMVEAKVELGHQFAENNTKTYHAARNLLLGILAIGVIIALLLGIFLTLSITRPLTQGVTMIQEMGKGHLGMRLRMNDRQDEIGQLATTMDQFADDLQKAVVGTMQKIAEGDLSTDVQSKDNQDEIGPALRKVTENLRGLIAEAGMLRKAAVEGRLATRGQADKFKGGYKDIVQGVNDTLDAVIGPLNVAAEYVDRISKGDIPPKIADNYNGDFNEIKNNLNRCIEALSGLIAEMNNMSHQHDLGDIDVVIPADKFDGAYKQMAEGVNKMVNGHIAVKKKAMACVAEFGKGNFDAPLERFPGKKVFINETIEALRTNLKNVSSEIGSLIEASKNGSLGTRGKAENYTGDWQKIVKGINEMLDAILLPINEAAQVLEKVAARDMTVRVTGDYKGDHAKIKNALNTAVENLDKALSQVAEAAEQVSAGSQQISSGSQSLAQGANEQASSLEEVSSSLEEMASMTKQNAENANQAKNLAGEANGNAQIGTEAMTKMSSSINKIKESSDQTAKIVKTIDEIAMQTNLLALNAAVEAARAGEAGRGFAVVAEEVRNLAQRSAQAAKNTADMISESVKNAEDGVKISQEVSKSFEAITASVKKVNDLIAEIAAASQEQSQGIDQVNTAVAQMDKVTQQNAANSEESASAAEEMSSQAEELQSMIAQFHLSSSGSTKTHAVHTLTHHVQPVQKQTSAPRQKVAAKPGKKEGNGHVNPEAIIPMNEEALKEF